MRFVPFVCVGLLACGSNVNDGSLDTIFDDADGLKLDVTPEVAPDVEDDQSGEDADTDDAGDDSSDIAPELPTPVCDDCDDDLDCTSDGCGIDGVCRNTVKEGFCAIAGRCVTAGFGSQCQVCAPQVDPNRYTPLTGGPCNDDDPCTEGEQCLGGICRGGEPVTCPAPDACEVSLGCVSDAGGCQTSPRPTGAVCGPGLVCQVAVPEPSEPAVPAAEPPPLCEPGDPFAIGTVAFFDRATCPSGWSLATELAGRTAVAVAPDAVGQTRGDPLLSGEDRKHSHTFSGSATAASTSFVGIVGGFNGLASAGTLTPTATDSGASAGLPYLQLLACSKVEDAAVGALPSELSTFASTDTCGDGDASITTYDRLIVATPTGGTSGASFGAGAASSHDHALSGTIPTTAKGIALASGCCGGGYASASGLSTTLTSTETEVVFPTLGLLQCELPAATSSTGEPDAAPPGMVLFSQSATCPFGWSVFAAAAGRILVGVALGGDVGLTVNTPLADREDRTHTHPVALTATLSQRNVAAANGPNTSGAAPGTVSATLPSAPGTSGLGFVQRLACRKDLSTSP